MIIRIKDLEALCMIGVYEQEKHQKQKLIVNMKIEFDEGQAGASDLLDDTLDYHPICNNVREMLHNNEYELVERAVNEVGKYLLSLDKVVAADVEIDKPEAPIEGIRCVSVSKYFKK